MELIRSVIKQMIDTTEGELDFLLQDCFVKSFKRKSIMSYPDVVPHEVFFINRGIMRVVILDNKGVEHTIHFGVEKMFIADYSNFLQHLPSIYSLQALEDMEVVVMPRASIERGYRDLKQGDKLGRLIAEGYFIYHDSRIKDMYFRTPKERYDRMNDVFPNIHNRVPQHMIASYIGITPVHLSRIKKEALLKT